MSKDKNIFSPKEVNQITCEDCLAIFRALNDLNYTDGRGSWKFNDPADNLLTINPTMRLKSDPEKKVHVSAQHRTTSEIDPKGNLTFSELCIIFSQGFYNFEFLEKVKK